MNINQLAIIIPAYKDTFLRDALDSIANQTCKDFTLYIGDDCSPYNLIDIVDEFKDKINIVYKRFETNLGGKDLVSQWERCIAMSNEEPYIWLFSDDDIMESHCVETFINLPREDKDNWLIHFDIKIIGEDNHIVKDLPLYQKEMTAKEYLDGKLFGHKNTSFVVEFIFSRELYNKCRGFQNYDLAWGADSMTWLKFSGSCRGMKTISTGNEDKVRWRSSSQNISPNKSKPIILRKLISIIYTRAFIKEWLILNDYKYSFKYSRYVWGEIKRNRKSLNKEDIDDLYLLYRKEIGPSFEATLNYIYVKYFA